MVLESTTGEFLVLLSNCSNTALFPFMFLHLLSEARRWLAKDRYLKMDILESLPCISLIWYWGGDFSLFWFLFFFLVPRTVPHFNSVLVYGLTVSFFVARRLWQPVHLVYTCRSGPKFLFPIFVLHREWGGVLSVGLGNGDLFPVLLNRVEVCSAPPDAIEIIPPVFTSHKMFGAPVLPFRARSEAPHFYFHQFSVLSTEAPLLVLDTVTAIGWRSPIS